MSVLVRGMSMPTECEYCGFCRYYPENGNVWCNANNRLLKREWINPDWTHLNVKRPEDCPLVGLPEKHGDLIDRQNTLRVLHDLGNRDYRREKGTIMDATKMVSHPEYTPTVIDREGKE